MFRNLLLLNMMLLSLVAATAVAQEGAVVRLVHPDSVSGVDTSSNQDRGVYVRMVRGFDVAAVTVRLDLSAPGDVTASIYEADNYVRGALVSTSTVAVTDLGNVEHTIPLTATLDPCSDYEVAVEFGGVDGWDYLDEGDIAMPYDRHGVAVVGSASVAGSAASQRIPHVSLVGASPGGTSADLTPRSYQWDDATCSDQTTDRSVFIRARQTVAVTSISFDYDPPSAPDTLIARIYEVNGNARGALLAEGRVVMSVAERRLWQVPINVILREGHQYDVAAHFPAGTWACQSEAAFGMPFEAGVIDVLDGASGGDPGSTVIPHFRMAWESQVGGIAVDLRQTPGVPPFTSTDATRTRSVYVFPISDQQAASIGWYADVPEGEVITARIYDASGVVRGSLVSEGSIVSTGGGERWHDIPVAATFHELQGYELNVAFGSVNLWRHWIVGQDYYVTPEIQVYAAGADGTGAPERPHMRFNGCYDVVTSAAGGPARPSVLVLRAAYPNPMSGGSIIEYQLDRAGTASIELFDVRGRLVDTLLEPTFLPAGDGAVSLNAATLSTGVYFVKLSMPHASVSRKISIVR